MDLGLTGKRALVLGSTRGLGRAIAEALAAEGAEVAICGLAAEDPPAEAADIASRHGIRAEGFAFDLGDTESVEALVNNVTAAFDGIDVLIGMSGGPPPGPITEVTAETWQAQFQAMFLGHCRITQAFLPGMRERRWGRILVSTSSGVVQPIPNLGISNTLRASLVTWSKTLAAEVAKDGITVNTLLPGRIHTQRTDQLDQAAAKRQGKTVEEIATASKATIPMGRYGAVEEYAAVAAFLASERASYVTGSMIRVDGGMIRGV